MIPIQVILCKHFFMYVTSYVCDQIAQTLEVHLPAKFSWVWISQINLDFYMDSVVKLDTRKRSWERKVIGIVYITHQKLSKKIGRVHHLSTTSKGAQFGLLMLLLFLLLLLI